MIPSKTSKQKGDKLIRKAGGHLSLQTLLYNIFLLLYSKSLPYLWQIQSHVFRKFIAILYPNEQNRKCLFSVLQKKGAISVSGHREGKTAQC